MRSGLLGSPSFTRILPVVGVGIGRELPHVYGLYHFSAFAQTLCRAGRQERYDTVVEAVALAPWDLTPPSPAEGNIVQTVLVPKRVFPPK